MKKWMSYAALALGSIWVVPVSCTGGLAAGTRIAARLDARDTARGDTVHRLFSVVVEPGENGQPFRPVLLAEVPRLRASGKAGSFLMSQAAGRITLPSAAQVSYTVVESAPEAQVIDVEYRNDDGAVSSRYRATRDGVTPLSSRMFHVGHMFNALPYAVAGSLLLYFIGRRLRKRTGGAKPAAQAG